jgi:hypothetical protein
LRRLAAVLGLAAAATAAAPQEPAPRLRWFKGNTHTHTLNSDGDSTPDEVVRWYREHNYNFLVLSDHDVLTKVDGLNAIYGAPLAVGLDRRPDVPNNAFLLIAGEELTDKFSPREVAGETVRGRDLTRKEVHLTALDPRQPVAPQGGATIPAVLQRDVNAVRAVSGVPIVNHPNFTWALSAADLQAVRGVKLFELWSGHLQTHNLGGGGRPGVEAIWDEVLSGGTLLYGVAADDAHFFQRGGGPGAMAGPGRAWVMVRAAELTAAAILAALERGDFYASTGVELADYQAGEKTITVAVKPFSRSKYDVVFIGKGGRVLKQVPIDPDLSGSLPTSRLEPVAPPAAYELRGDEGYVRAKVVESNGAMAWTQPVMVPAR